MAKNRTAYVCQECGYSSAKWFGRCPGCGLWNTLVEEEVRAPKGVATRSSVLTCLKHIPALEFERAKTGIGELDRVLGGGIVSGSLVLLGGDPGIGKSTLLLQAGDALSSRGKKVLYISGEESVRQVRMRADRLGIEGENIFIVNETNIDFIVEYISDVKPGLVIVDSIQTMYTSVIGSAPGSVAQLRECTARLMGVVKKGEGSVFLVGHVTKEGLLAGPKVLEHMVDTVIYFEGDKNTHYRVLRAVKNRFGPVNEIGIMEMTGRGLIEAGDISRLFLGQSGRLPGSSVVVSFEGTRAFLIEVEALVVPSSYGYPRRMASGVDANRLSLIAAVLEKRAGIPLGNHDVYIKVAQGAVLREPASDLGLAAAMVSSFMEKEMPEGLVVIGELGLSGEVRPVPYMEMRLTEAAKMGFVKVLVPKGTHVNVHGDLEMAEIGRVSELLLLF